MCAGIEAALTGPVISFGIQNCGGDDQDDGGDKLADERSGLITTDSGLELALEEGDTHGRGWSLGLTRALGSEATRVSRGWSENENVFEPSGCGTSMTAGGGSTSGATAWGSMDILFHGFFTRSCFPRSHAVHDRTTALITRV